jgi:ectoine hydroxylase-related dioxygenase (phytanoyl-CoA dioxygenase family)
VTDLDAPYPLTPEQIGAFRDDGYIKLKDVLSAETLKEYGEEITRLVVALNGNDTPLAERTTYGKAFLQVGNLWRHSALVETFVRSKRLARIAADLLEVEGVRLYHDQALYKEDGGGITPWHADQYYWPISSDRSVTVWVPLQPTPLDMGPLEFAKGSHHLEVGREMEISGESERAIQQSLVRAGYPTDQAAYDLGDVSFHRGWTFHRAGANRSGRPRKVMTVIYVDADITVTEPTNQNQIKDMNSWMPGTAAGQVPATPLNPVLFP